MTAGKWCAVQEGYQTNHVPIIGLSAYALDSERETAMAKGCDEFNVKPIEFESLVASIRRVV